MTLKRTLLKAADFLLMLLERSCDGLSRVLDVLASWIQDLRAWLKRA
jgi:hypothetical protein